MRILIGTLILATLATATGCGSTAEDAKDLVEATATFVPSATSASTTAPETSPTATRAASTPTSVPASIKVAESGFATYQSSIGMNLVWFALLQNTSTTQQATSLEVTVIFFDAANLVLKTEKDYPQVIFPGQTGASGGVFVTVPGVPTRMEVRVSTPKFQSGASTAGLAISDVRFQPDRFSPKIVGKVTNPFNKDISNAEITCVATTGDTLIGVGQTYLQLIPAGATAVAECSMDSRLPGVASAETYRMFATVSILSQIGN